MVSYSISNFDKAYTTSLKDLKGKNKDKYQQFQKVFLQNGKV